VRTRKTPHFEGLGDRSEDLFDFLGKDGAEAALIELFEFLASDGFADAAFIGCGRSSGCARRPAA
jgi:hypothetical protein